MRTQQFTNLDDAQTIFFARELESVKSKTYDTIRAPLKAFELIPVDNSAGSGAETIVYYQYDSTGIARIIANYADDLPRADVKGKEFIARIRSIGNSYGYSLQEIRAAQFAGKSLDQRKSDAAVTAQRELWNKIAFYGDETHGLQGWLTNPNIPSNSVAADGAGGGGSSTLWVNKTPAQILRDLNTLVNGIVGLTNGAEKPDTVVMPIAQYTLLATTQFSAGTDTTILDYFLKNSPFVKTVEWANELKNANRDAIMGAGNDPFVGDIMIAYQKSSDKLTFEMPQPFEQLPAQERGLEFVVPCHSRVGGTLVYYPLSMSIGEGI